jgi:hypothetical protein
MNHRLGRMFCLMVFSLLTTAVFAQQEFSADLVDNSEKASSTQNKIYAGKDKLRFEGQQNGRAGTMIINFAAQTTDILIPERKMYIESTAGHGPAGQRSFNLFRAADPENACEEWRKTAAKSGGSCRKIGNETVNGRSTVKYEGTSEDGTVNYVWIDPKLHFPVKWQGKDKGNGGELRNIQEGSQPAGLFVVPPDYQKMDMGNMGMPGSPPRR